MARGYAIKESKLALSRRMQKPKGVFITLRVTLLICKQPIKKLNASKWN